MVEPEQVQKRRMAVMHVDLGIDRLTVLRMDIQHPTFAPRSFDVVTMLEVLEHLRNPQAALDGVMKVATRFVLLPSVPDDNPDHLHPFNPDQLHQMVASAGASRITIEHVLNHRIMLIRVTA